ncbi:MAG: PP2C family protein-serine/threonine phosphatase [Saccharofermentans sp.]|nr:PP2C family protein-serine/threonine phosphatase [Saccharofermentans sp.]
MSDSVDTKKTKIKKIRKPRKAILQIGIVFFLVFIVVLCCLSMTVAIAVVILYLSSKNEDIEQDLDKIEEFVNDESIPHMKWVFDYWRDHPKEVTADRFNYKYEADSFGDYGQICDEALYPFDYTTEHIMSLPEDKQLEVAVAVYNRLIENMNMYSYVFEFNDIYIVDLTEENRGFIYFDKVIAYDDPEGSGLGEVWDYNTLTHYASGYYDDNSFRNISFEIVADPRFDGNKYYVGYLPIYIDDEIRGAVCITYDWSPFEKKLMSSIWTLLSIGIIVGLAAACLLMLAIYLLVIRPLSVVTKNVESYTVHKDSKDVIEKLSRVRSKNEVGVLVKDFSILADEMDRYAKEVSTLASEKERVQAELEMAAKIQMSMLPSDYPESDAFELYASMVPAKEVGGDFYDFFMIGDDHIGLVIADVSGKGVPAAMFMAMSKMYIRTFASSCKSPAEALIKANKAIDANNENAMFVTVWLGIIDLNTGKVQAANAGHEYPMLCKSKGAFEVLKDKHSLMLGAFPNLKAIEYEFTLGKGDILFVYTDGAPEAADSGNNMFGMERLVDALNEDPDRSPEQLIRGVNSAISSFVGEADQFDDLTMLCLKYRG